MTLMRCSCVALLVLVGACVPAPPAGLAKRQLIELPPLPTAPHAAALMADAPSSP